MVDNEPVQTNVGKKACTLRKICTKILDAIRGNNGRVGEERLMKVRVCGMSTCHIKDDLRTVIDARGS